MRACARSQACCAPGPKRWSTASRSWWRSRKQLERDLANAKRQLALGGGGSAAGNGAAEAAAEQAVRTVGKVKFMARAVKGLEPRDLRGLVDDGKTQLGSGVVAIVGVTEDGKANLTVGVTDDLSGRISALELIKAGAEALGAKGAGGKATFAQTGGTGRLQGRGGAQGHRGQARIAGVLNSIQVPIRPAPCRLAWRLTGRAASSKRGANSGRELQRSGLAANAGARFVRVFEISCPVDAAATQAEETVPL